ncbi:MAG TPA: cytochrome c-550 PedF [Hyphomicrobium sp.]|nr:cytochrome c-550 PedF [Hyphomicrobium sp.]
MTLRALFLALACLIAAATQQALAHGDGAPQPVDTTGLTPLGDDWRVTNPYREAGPEHDRAVEIGSRGYNSNCARCHGLEVKSGGMAPDLRHLGETEMDDAWFTSRVLGGARTGDSVKMPPFDGLLSQEAIWAIRTYIDAQPE